MEKHKIEALQLQADTIEEAIATQLQVTVAHIEQMKHALSNALAMLGTLREKIKDLGAAEAA